MSKIVVAGTQRPWSSIDRVVAGQRRGGDRRAMRVTWCEVRLFSQPSTAASSSTRHRRRSVRATTWSGNDSVTLRW